MGGGISSSSFPQSLSVSDFVIDNCIAEGHSGKIFAGKDKRSGAKVALKFFGYTVYRPTTVEVKVELRRMLALRDIAGIVHTYGHFMDTANGLAPGKVHKMAYPVIVMEYLEGGHLLDHIYTRPQEQVSEGYISLLFRNIIIGLDSMHKKGYIHRDLKCENIMLVRSGADSPAKIIDLGMMVRLPQALPPSAASSPKKGKSKSPLRRDSRCMGVSREGSASFVGGLEVFQDSECVGTAGYCAPESVLHREYSSASDLWQAGCILYTLLSGLKPFHPNAIQQVTELTYYPMTGRGWDGISAQAKELVRRLLTKDSSRRYTVHDVLSHPWMQQRGLEASEVPLDIAYLSRIKRLALSHHMREFFQAHISEASKGLPARRVHLAKLLPFLMASSHMQSPATSPLSLASTSPDHTHDSHGGSGSGSGNSLSIARALYQHKLKQFKQLVLRQACSPEKPSNSVNGDSGGATAREDTVNTETPLSQAGGIDWSSYLALVKECDLPELASKQAFDIFDHDGSGTIRCDH